MNALLFLQLIAPLIPHVIKTVEQVIPGPKQGKRKRARAIKTIETLAASVPHLAVTAAEITRELGKEIDSVHARLKAAGELAPPP